MIRAFKYRVRLRPGEEAPFLQAMEECRLFYNAELEQSLATFVPWLEQSRSVRERGEKAPAYARYHWQGRSQVVTAWSREHPGFDQLNRNCRVASTTQRLHEAWSGFWRRWKPGVHPEQAGIPHFIRYGAFGSLKWAVSGISYHPAQGAPGTPQYRTHRVALAPFGRLRLFEDRPLPLPEGSHIKTATLSQEADGWHVSLVIDDGVAVPEARVGRAIGVDLGARNFAVTSEGAFFTMPDFYREGERRLRALMRTQARRLEVSRAEAARRVAQVEALPPESWGSTEERDTALRAARRYRTQGFAEARKQVARHGQEIARCRLHHHHEIARALCETEGVGTIYLEALQVRQMLRRPQPKDGQASPSGQAARHTALSKSISNAGWYSFLLVLRHHAAQRGVSIVTVDPSDTSQICNQCGTKAQRYHPYWKPTFICAGCGAAIDSDLNAARNILSRGESSKRG